ncbi:MAG: hypothetical protein U0992_24165 [Planctomycetaceae bacterium]
MSSQSQPAPKRRSRIMAAPADQSAQRAAQREILRHHVTRIKLRCTAPELTKPESRTALSLRLVLFADTLLQSGMLGSVEDLTGNPTELTLRGLLRHAFMGDARQVERILQDVAGAPAADQAKFCELIAEVGWRLFDGPQQSSGPEVRAG